MSAARRQQCTAMSKRSGEQCRRWALNGAMVCHMHGGAARQVRAAGARRVAEAKAAAALAKVEGFAVPVDVHPTEALLGLVRQSAGLVVWLEQLVRGLEVDEFGRGGGEVDEAGEVRADPGRLIGRDHLGEQAPHIWLTLWNQERERLAKFSKLAVDAGVAEATVRLTAELAREVAGRIRLAFASVGVDPSSERARVALRAALVGTAELDDGAGGS